MLPSEGSNHHCQSAGFPSALLGRIVKANVTIAYEGLSPDGDLTFTLRMRDLGLSRTVMARTPTTKTSFFVNLVGELLVRKNIAVFAEVLEKLDPKDYDRMVNCFRHRHFGMTVETNDLLRFRFHSSLVQHILTENLEGVV
jgi:hypothetical protein